jgi:hypothetical protein
MTIIVNDRGSPGPLRRWQQLATFNGETPPAFSGDNNETFNSLDTAKSSATVCELDEVMTAWERAVEAADEQKLQKWASTIAHIGAHNAYHIGQMITCASCRARGIRQRR